jgi:hypothetical protein
MSCSVPLSRVFQAFVPVDNSLQMLEYEACCWRQKGSGARVFSLLKGSVARKRGILFWFCHCLWSFCCSLDAP